MIRWIVNWWLGNNELEVALEEIQELKDQIADNKNWCDNAVKERDRYREENVELKTALEQVASDKARAESELHSIWERIGEHWNKDE